jgi:tetratricopeptide (TPR) repeat protein
VIAVVVRGTVGSLTLAPLLASLLLAAPPATGGASRCDGAPYECAVAHVRSGEHQAALGLLEGILARTPRDLKALNLAGIALTSAGRPDEGAQRFRQALTADPSFYPARKNLGLYEFARGRVAEAQSEFEEVLKQAPDDEAAHLHLAEIHFRANDLTAALPHYEKAGPRAAQRPEWTLHHAASLLAAARPDDALVTLSRLPEGDAAAQFEAGVLLGKAGRHADAARFFGRARAGGPRAGAAAYNQLLMHVEAGDHVSAASTADELLAPRPASAELYNLAARAYLGAQRVQQAYDALRTAAQLEPGNEEHYLDLAAIALEHHNYDLALEIVEVGLRNLPRSWRLFLQRGVVHAVKVEMAPAERAFEAARALAPDQAAPYAALAMAWMQMGQADRAVQVLRERLARGADPVVSYTFAMALSRSGVDPAAPEAEEAVTALRAALGTRPDFAPARGELGRLLLRRGDLHGAITELTRAVADDPASSAALYNLSQAYMKKGDRAQAAEMARRVSRLNAQERGDDPEAEVRRVVFRLIREGSTAPAPAAAASAPAPEAGTAEWHAQRARALAESGRVGDAVAGYQRALFLDPAHAEAANGLSGLCAALGDLDGAIAMLRRVVAARPSAAGARYDLALNLWNRYRAGGAPPLTLEDAAQELRAAARAAPANPAIHALLGQVLAQQQALPEAAASLRRAAELAPDDAAHAYDLGLVRQRQGDLEGAEDRFRAALARDPAHASARRALGLVLRQTGRLEAAEVEFAHVVERQAQDAQAHSLLGAVKLRRGDVQGALVALGQAVRLDPRLIEAHVALAQALARAGRGQESQAAAAEARRLREEEAAQGRAMVLMDAAAAHRQAGRAEAAVSSLREAVAAGPTLPEAHYRLALALRKAGASAAELQAALLRVLELAPEHAPARYEVARTLAAQGETDSALLQLRQALARQPSLTDARRELARLAAAEGDWPTAIAELEAVLAWDPADGATRQALETARRMSSGSAALQLRLEAFSGPSVAVPPRTGEGPAPRSVARG